MRFSQLFLKMWFGRRESRGTIHEKHGFQAFLEIWFGGEESRGDNGLAGERRNPPQSRLPQTCLLALTLTLSPSPKLAFSSIFVSHLPSSSSHFQLLHPALLHLPPSFFRPLLPHPSHISALVPCPRPLPASLPPRPHKPGRAVVLRLGTPLHPLLLRISSCRSCSCSFLLPLVLQSPHHVLFVVFPFLRFLLLS